MKVTEQLQLVNISPGRNSLCSPPQEYLLWAKQSEEYTKAGHVRLSRIAYGAAGMIASHRAQHTTGAASNGDGSTVGKRERASAYPIPGRPFMKDVRSLLLTAVTPRAAIAHTISF